MKSNNFFIVLALCVAMQPGMSLASQNPEDQTYWQQYAPQFMQNIGSYLSEKYENTIGKWSTQKKMLVASAVLASLVGVYYRDQIMKMIVDVRAEKGMTTGMGGEVSSVEKTPNLNALKEQYAEVAKEYVQSDAAHRAAKAEFRKHRTREMDEKVYQLGLRDREVLNRLNNIGAQMEEAGMTKGDVKKFFRKVSK